MKHSQRAKVILSICMLLVGLSSAVALVKAFRPTAGLPYEQVTLEQAEKYMEFEEGYVLADVSTEEEYAKGHMAGAVCIPYETLVEKAIRILPDKQQMIYVYAYDNVISGNACRKLSELGYSSVTQIYDVGCIVKESETE